MTCSTRLHPAAAIVVTVLGLAAPGRGQCEVAKVHATDAVEDSFFGDTSVAIDRDVMLVGASGAEAAYVFRFDGTTWAQEAKLTASDGETGDRFGLGTAVSCNVAIVGARLDDGVGAAYVFRFDGTTWTEEAKLVAPAPEADDDFGFAVTIRGDVALIGAPEFGSQGTGSAYAFRYDRASGAWDFEQTLAPGTLQALDAFGKAALSPCGTVAVIAAPYDDHAGSQSGAVYVYRHDGTQWIEEARLTASDAAHHQYFGISAGIDGDVIAVGAFTPLDAGGAVYVFRFDRATGTWNEETKIAPAELDVGDWFGWNLALSGDMLAVLAVHDDDAAEDAGAVYVYRGSGGTWQPETKLFVSNPVSAHLFGAGLAADRDQLAIGAPGDDDNGTNTGAAYVFAGLSGVDYNGNGVADVCEAFCPADTNGDGTVGFDDLLTLLSNWGTCP